MSLYTPTDEDSDALEILVKRDDLSEWEESFLASLSERDEWTEKQRQTFEQLWERKMERR